MASVRGRFEYSDGLTPGRSKDGGLHHNLYDDQGDLVGHGKFIPDGEGEGEGDSAVEPPPISVGESGCGCESDSRSRERLDPEEVAEALIMLIKFATWTAPRLKVWWKEQALPFAKSTRSRFSRTRKDVSSDVSEESVTVVGSTPAESSREVIAELEEDRVSMDGEEASVRFAAALVAKLFSDEQMEILRNARIEGEGGSLELSAVEQLTLQQVMGNVGLILEANPSLVTRETLAELGKLLARTKAVEGVRSIEE
ncbi:hypothetical protein [Streptomyces sp. sk226]|uniref:hypothetical protein n=1 Tax=Streptomyces sp. sk226 TaxID=2034268 RepID=UPI0011851F2C|nr:hypothetical protein [Streptomyces sp. sk226]